MPHRAGHSPVPDFGIGEIGPIGTGGYNPNAVMDRLAQLEASNQLYFPDGRPRFPLNVMEPYRQGIGRENLARGAASFVPGVGTAVNWGQMGPWERALSVGLDAADLLTLGGGKALTASLRGLMNLAKYNPFDPKMISFRGGLPPVDEFGNYTVSTSNLTGLPEPGVSVYQGAQFPFGRGTVIRPAINELTTYTHLADPELTLPLSSPLRSLKHGEQYSLNPRHSQNEFLRQRAEDMYRIAGDVMPWAQGSDLEALVNPATIRGVTPMPVSEFKHITGPFSGLDDYTKAVNQFTGMPFASPSMTKKALNLFSKYDPQGTRIPNAIDQWLARARLASTIPATVPARGVNYTWNTPGIFGGVAPANRGNSSPGG